MSNTYEQRLFASSLALHALLTRGPVKLGGDAVWFPAETPPVRVSDGGRIEVDHEALVDEAVRLGDLLCKKVER